MNRYTLFPIQYPSLYEFYKTQRDSFWVPADIDLTTDVKEWRMKLSDEERSFLTYILAFFAQVDSIVMQNLQVNFSFDCDIPEANLFYSIQGGIEAIHWEMYSLLIDTLIEDQTKKQEALNAIQHYPCIAKKAEWMKRYMDPSIDYLTRLIAFCCAEGIFFSSAFASIYFFKKRGLLPGVVLSNQFIARDEGLHRDFGCELFKVLGGKSNDKYIAIIKECVEIEQQFVDDSLQVNLIGMNATKMKQYVGVVADNLLVQLGFKKIYHTTNPFDWMNMINLSNKQNFFENRVSEYKKQKTSGGFNLNVDF